MGHLSTAVIRGALRATGALVLAFALVVAGSAGLSAQAKTVIEWWDDHSYEQLEAFQEVIALFEERNPDIEVRLSLVEPGVYYDRLAISFVSGEAGHLLSPRLSGCPVA